jgi:hypothetical protein
LIYFSTTTVSLLQKVVVSLCIRAADRDAAMIQFSAVTLAGMVLISISFLSPIHAFSATQQIPLGGIYNLERFQSICPANLDAIRQFDPSLASNDSDSDNDDGRTSSSVWVAVYRSNNNKPSVMVRDEFFHAMNAATSGRNTKDGKDGNQNSSSSSSFFLSQTRSLLEITPHDAPPVAVAQLRPSPDFDGCYVLDSLRCSLKKEDMDESCDGGSEFLEALSVAVDSLVLHHLQQLLSSSSWKGSSSKSAQEAVFEGTLRTKATLFSGKILEQRGFEPVDELSKDMATHVSTYEACLHQYAERSIPGAPPPSSGRGMGKTSKAKSRKAPPTVTAGARDRALQIVALLGQLDPQVQRQAAEDRQNSSGDDEEYDPFAGINLRR